MKRWLAATLALLFCFALSAHRVSAFGRLAVGDELTDFRLPSLAGETVRLSQALGTKATVVVFWATWSPRSAEALADLQQLYAQYAPAGLGVIAVNVDGEGASSARPETVATAVGRAGVAYAVVIDEDLEAFRELGVVAVPSIVLTDASRRIVALVDGYAPATRRDFRERVLEIVGAARTGVEPAPSAPGADQPTGSAAKYLQMGRLYLEKGRRKDGLKVLAQAVAEDPGNAEACAELVEVLERLGRYEEAARVGAQLAHLRTKETSGSLH
jgi:peroxiredoxin